MATLHRIRLLLGVPIPAGARDRNIAQISSIASATPDSLVFATTEDTLVAALASRAAGILAPTWSPAGDRIVAVEEPRTSFAIVYDKWFDERGRTGIHSTAIIEGGAILGPGCEIGAGAFIGSGVILGERCVIGPRVVIYAGTTLGNCVRVQAGTVLGAEGFGYVRTPEGHLGFPQIGTLSIGDNVEIGANCTIDRGALGETRIGRGTKIDNLAHIAHNCILGENVLVAAQVGLAGSCVIEDGAMLGGQVGLGERATIGRGVILGGQGGLLPGKRIDGEGTVYWGTPAQPVREYLRDLARLRKH